MVNSNQQNYTKNIKKSKSQKKAPKVKDEKREIMVIAIIECTVKTIKTFVSKCYSENKFRSCPFLSKTLTPDLKFYRDAVIKTVAFFVKSEALMVLTVNSTVL
jgi:hypothetical protein